MREVFITSSVLILALLVLRLLFRRRIPRRAQYALWALVLARLLIPISLPAAPFSVLSSAPRVQTGLTASMARPVYLLPVGIAPAADYPGAEKVAPGETVPSGASFGYPILSDDGQTVTQYAEKRTVGEVLTAVWLAGIAAMACFFLVTNLLFWRRLRKGRTPYPVEGCKRPVYLCEGLPSPCLFGLLRPAIYLTPAAVRAPDTLRHVLAHEETHARHLDPLWSLLRCLCLTVYWFHPLVWAAAWASKADCELACDEGTLRRLGEEERLAYGQTLLALIPVRQGPGNPLLAATTMTAGKRQLKNRVIRIAERRRTLTVALVAVIILALAVAACTFTGANKEGRRPLTAEELRYFNEEYFNGANVGASVYINPHNYFISSLYDSPENIDLYELFYLGIFDENGQFSSPSDEESRLVYGETAPDCASYKQTTAEMDAFLTKYTGLTLAQTNQRGLDSFTYLPEYDAYYWAHGDTNYRRPDITVGEREGELIHLYYDARGMGLPDTTYACLTLKETEDGYHFLSNLACEKPTIPTPLPNRDPVLTIPPDSLPPYQSPALTVERHMDDCAERFGGYRVGDHTIRLYRSTDGNTYAAVMYNEAAGRDGMAEWDAGVFMTLPDGDSVNHLDGFSDLLGHDGIVLSYPGVRDGQENVTVRDYIYFTTDGTPTLLARANGDAKILDLDGDGTDELVSDDQIFFRRDGKVYAADLRTLLPAAWPEMTDWNYAAWDPYGNFLSVYGRYTVPGEEGYRPNFTRYLYFDGKNILVYKGGETKNHVLDSVSAPEEVLSAAKEKALAAYEAIKAGAPDTLTDQNFDDWRVASLDRVDLQMYDVDRPRGDIEVYTTNYDFHSATPRSVICAGGSSVDEDGWYSGFYVRESPYLVFQVKDGTRVQLESALPGYGCTATEFQSGFYKTLLQNGLISANDSALLPEGAAQFETRLRDWIIPQYGELAEGESFTLDYRSDPPQIDDLDCWAFDAYRGTTVTGFGSENCLGRYYADKTTGLVYHHKTPDWFLAQIPNSFLFPETIPSETVQNDILHHVWRQIPETGYEYGRVTVFPPNVLTLTASYPDWHFPDEPGDGGSVGVYHCPVTLPERPDWTDPTPYLVLSPASGGGYYYLGALDEVGANSEAAVRALADAYAAVDVQYVNFRIGNDAYDAATGYYTNDDYHFTWQLPDGVRNDILFRDTGRGVGVYFRPTYERYVAEHRGVDDGAVSDPVGCGRLLEIIAGPEKTRLYDGTNWDALSILPMCQNDGDLLNALPAPNGWYYAAYTDVAWLPGSAWAWYYPQQAQALLQAFRGLNPV